MSLFQTQPRKEQPAGDRAAWLHAGRAKQPTPTPAGTRAAVLHMGRARQPAATPASTRAALLHGTRPNLALGTARLPTSPAAVKAGISFNIQQSVGTPGRLTSVIKVNLNAELYNISTAALPEMTSAIERRFAQAVRQTHALPVPPGSRSLQRVMYQFVPGEITINERLNYRNTAGKFEIVVVDHVLGRSGKGTDAAGISNFNGSHLFVGRNIVANMAASVVHELGHAMGLRHTWDDNFLGNDNDPANIMSYNRRATAAFSGEQLFLAFINQSGFMNGPNYQMTTEDLNNLYGESTNERPIRANTGRGVAIPVPVRNTTEQ